MEITLILYDEHSKMVCGDMKCVCPCVQHENAMDSRYVDPHLSNSNE